jgi:choline dehydrogenase
MANQSFIDEATAQFNERPARGPYTLGMSNTALFMPLPNMSISYMDTINKIRGLASEGSGVSYLPAAYRNDRRMAQGYARQLTVLADLLANPQAPSLESAFATGTSLSSINLHPLSRGTVRLNPGSPLEPPVVDYRTGSNPVDWDLYLTHLRYLRRLGGTATFRAYGAVEAAPLRDVPDDDDALVRYVKDSMVFSFMHPCCTAAMMPESKGGVVGPDLGVFGAAGLRVVDMGVLPFLPSSHLSSTAYAVGEKVSCIKAGDFSGL